MAKLAQNEMTNKSDVVYKNIVTVQCTYRYPVRGSHHVKSQRIHQRLMHCYFMH